MGDFGIISGVISLAYQWYQSEQAEEAADEAARKKKQQIDLSKRIEEASARRAARVRKAKIAAAAGAKGVRGTTFESSIRGIETSLQSTIDLLEEQTTLQAEQFDIAAENTASQAESKFLGSLGTFAGDVLGGKYDKPKTTTTTGGTE